MTSDKLFLRSSFAQRTTIHSTYVAALISLQPYHHAFYTGMEWNCLWKLTNYKGLLGHDTYRHFISIQRKQPINWMKKQPDFLPVKMPYRLPSSLTTTGR